MPTYAIADTNVEEDRHDEGPCTVPALRLLRQDVRISRESFVADYRHAYLRMHAAVAVQIAGVGNRGTNFELRASYTTHPTLHIPYNPTSPAPHMNVSEPHW